MAESVQNIKMFSVEELQLSAPDKCEKVGDILKCLQLTDDMIAQIKRIFIEEMELALNMQPSSLQMENTYIPELLDGTEDGVFLAMDLGGTNLRVLLLTLSNGQVMDETVQHYNLADELRTGCGTVLFDFLAECVDAFMVAQGLDDSVTYSMGFTFSFPMQQSALDAGVLVTWTKSFNCPSVVGREVVAILRTSLAKCGRHNVNIVAILNDTTGTLMHGALLDRRTRIGIVLGTGSNGCFMERADRVKHWEHGRHGEHHVIIDVEWGAFGDNGVLDFMKTKFDRAVDNASLLVTSFTFEKYIGGKYLGELCRTILRELYDQRLFLAGLPAADFPAVCSYGSDNISLVEQDTLNNSWEHSRRIFHTHFHTEQYSTDDLEILRYVCGLISLRAAQLVAINTATLLNRMDDDETDVTVAIDGSVYKHHPRLRHWIADYTTLWAPHKKSKFILAEDGSGKGAALVAAIAEKIRKRGY